MSNTNSLLLIKAKDFTETSLAGKLRKSGEPVVNHCQRVADILTSFQVNDEQTLAVAILHHTLQDSAATITDLQEEFGEEITKMVKTFESLRIIRLKPGMEDEFVENLRKMFLVLAKDLRVVLVKMADILDNLRTLKYLEPAKSVEVARETLEIFAPLAERLGMGEMRGQMQDLAFPFADPEGYKWVAKYSQKRLIKLDKVMLRIKSRLRSELNKAQIQAEIQSRVKHLYSLYKKLQRPEIAKDINKVYDLVALRVIVETIEECYKVYDIVLHLFKQLSVPARDHIAHPKPNGYRSIHLSVSGPSNVPFEIQIRTFKMHEEAEYGIAAHWHYAEYKERETSDEKLSQGIVFKDNKLEWVKRLAQWQTELSDDQDFLKTIKTDFFGERIFCFTPKGDVKDLPAGATPIDFAYQVHTDLGNLVIAAKINGKVIGLDTQLKNADVVQLILSKNSKKKPNRDWLRFVKTSLAKRKIKKFYS